MADLDMQALLKHIERDGWDVALYDFFRNQIKKNVAIQENERSVDWKYFLPLTHQSIALVVGCGWGVGPVSLSETCGKVYALDSDWYKVAMLNQRKRAKKLKYIFPIHAHVSSQDFCLPFVGEKFDLIAIRDIELSGKPLKLADLLRSLKKLLKPGGYIYLSVGNRWSPYRWLSNDLLDDAIQPHSLWGYKHIFKREGFDDMQIYAPLPHHQREPLFYLPVKGAGPIQFFFSHIFSLFDTASPEVKQAYRKQYKIAKMVVQMATIFRLVRWIPYGLPGFNIIAKKTDAF